MEITLYEKLIAHFGGPTEAAKALRVTPTVVDNWRTRGLPSRRALEIEVATGGAIAARDILASRLPSAASDQPGRAAA